MLVFNAKWGLNGEGEGSGTGGAIHELRTALHTDFACTQIACKIMIDMGVGYISEPSHSAYLQCSRSYRQDD